MQCGMHPKFGATGLGCGRSIEHADYLYRCADCDTAFHKDCIRQHFDWKESGKPHCSYPPSTTDSIHVVPTNKGHRTMEDGGCWCQPQAEWHSGLDGKQRPLYIHKDEQA